MYAYAWFNVKDVKLVYDIIFLTGQTIHVCIICSSELYSTRITYTFPILPFNRYELHKFSPQLEYRGLTSDGFVIELNITFLDTVGMIGK